MTTPRTPADEAPGAREGHEPGEGTKKAPVPPWGPVQPRRAFPRPDGVWWARAGEIDRSGYGGWLCDISTHKVYLAERGEPNKRGEREQFFVCDDCGAVHKPSKRKGASRERGA